MVGRLAGRRSPRQTPGVLPDEQLTPQQIALLRRMTPADKWEVARRLYWTARRHKAAFLRSQHPEWTEESVEAETRRVFLHARD